MEDYLGRIKQLFQDYIPNLNRIQQYTSPLQGQVNQVMDKYVQNPQGEMFPEAVWKSPQEEQRRIWQDFFTQLTMGATLGPTGLRDIKKYPNIGKFKKALSAQLDETGTNLIRENYYYHVAEGNKPFVNKGEVWLTGTEPLGRPGNVFAIDKSKIDVSNISRAANDPVYRLHKGNIPKDAIIPLGERTTFEPFDVAEKLYKSVMQQFKK